MLSGFPNLNFHWSKAILWVAFVSFSLSLISQHKPSEVPEAGLGFRQISLTEGWQFRQVGETQLLPATVPGVVQADLVSLGKIPDPYFGVNEKLVQWVEAEDWEYFLNLSLPDSSCESGVVELVFEGLDTYAEVFLDGKLILKADNMFRSWVVDVSGQLSPTSELRILFRSPLTINHEKWLNKPFELPAGNDTGEEKISVYTRKAPFQFGWDWAPRMVTMGPWRPVYLRCRTAARLAIVDMHQLELTDQKAIIRAEIEVFGEENISGKPANGEILIRFGKEILERKVISVLPGQKSIVLDFSIDNPRLWWTRDLGEPFLYDFEVDLYVKGEWVQSVPFSHGIRTIELVREADEIGRSFYFRLNGKPVFMKGANYIPSDAMIVRNRESGIRTRIKDAVASNMNMLRVWGGGIYEDDLFYSLCDQNGILVWQDFMFACSLYPADSAFLDNVAQEAIQNIRRLRRHPCLAIWCGNNEIDVAFHNWGWQKQYNWTDEQKDSARADYEAVFQKLLPKLVQENDPQTPYIHSSPLSNWGKIENFNFENMHYWGVWHGEDDFNGFRKYVPRFMAEYGFQSFPGLASLRTFSDEKDLDFDSEVMRWHQKSYRGNGMITKFMEQYFGNPSDFSKKLYLSQLVQAIAYKEAIESHRVAKPHCMGTLYWQLNDCWPGPSWSGIDYQGRWKAVQYQVRDLYQPVIVVSRIESGPEPKISVYLISDRAEPFKARLELTLLDFEGVELWEKSELVELGSGQSQKSFEQNLSSLLLGFDSTRVVLVARVFEGKELLHENLLYFARPKHLKLQLPNMKIRLKETKEGITAILKSETLVRNVHLSVKGINPRFSDNFFDLLPGFAKIVKISDEKLNLMQFPLEVTSLRDAD